MNEQFGVSWPTLIAQCVNLFLGILFLSLPFILWNRFKKREEKRNLRLDEMQKEIDELKARWILTDQPQPLNQRQRRSRQDRTIPFVPHSMPTFDVSRWIWIPQSNRVLSSNLGNAIGFFVLMSYLRCLLQFCFWAAFLPANCKRQSCRSRVG